MNRRRELTVTVLTLAGMTAVFFAAVYLPGRQASARLRDEIIQAQAEIARSPLVLSEFQAAREELNRQRDYVQKSSASVTDPHDVLETVSRLAEASGLIVVRLEPEAIVRRASYAEHPYRLEFRGSLTATSKFLGGLEKSDRVHAVAELNVHDSGAVRIANDLEGVLRFTVYAASADSVALAEENGSRGPQ